jgi:hypothetical protein
MPVPLVAGSLVRLAPVVTRSRRRLRGQRGRELAFGLIDQGEIAVRDALNRGVLGSDRNVPDAGGRIAAASTEWAGRAELFSTAATACRRTATTASRHPAPRFRQPVPEHGPPRAGVRTHPRRASRGLLSRYPMSCPVA